MSLELIEKTDRAVAVTTLLLTEGPLVAEKALDKLADVEGDKAVQYVLKKLSPLAVADIVRHFDFTKPSIVAMLLTPSQLCKAIERMPLFGRTGQDIFDVVTSVILQEDDWKKRAPYFRAIAKADIAVQAFAVGMLHVAGNEKPLFFARTGSFDLNAEDPEKASESTLRPGDWEELLFCCKKSAPSLFNSVIGMISGTVHDHAENGWSLERDLVARAKRKFGNVDTAKDDPYQNL